MERNEVNAFDCEVKQVISGIISKVEQNKRVAYVFNSELLKLVDQLPKVKGRANLVHQLITAYGLHEKLICVQSEPATKRELRLFHSEEYVEYLESINNAIANDTEDQFTGFSQFMNEEFGICYDCPPIPRLYDTIGQIAGSTLTCIKAIIQLKFDYVINWFGGWHHSRQSEAAGFCYVNDIVIAILYLLQLSDPELQRLYRKLDSKEVLTIKSPLKNRFNASSEIQADKSVNKSIKPNNCTNDQFYEFQDENTYLVTSHSHLIGDKIRTSPAKKPRKSDHRSEASRQFKRILYIDLDLHHGDAVQDAFANTDRVFTLSFHKHEQGFYPGTGSIKDIGFGRKGLYHNLNVPLKDGLSDESFEYISNRILNLVNKTYQPNLIMVQCGADTLSHDPMNSFNLTLNSIGNCIRTIKSFQKPTIFLGGGGYNLTNTARLWTFLTSIITNEPISNDIPEHEQFLEYKPTYELHVQSSHVKDKNNSRSYLDQLILQAEQNLSQIKLLD